MKIGSSVFTFNPQLRIDLYILALLDFAVDAIKFTVPQPDRQKPGDPNQIVSRCVSVSFDGDFIFFTPLPHGVPILDIKEQPHNTQTPTRCTHR